MIITAIGAVGAVVRGAPPSSLRHFQVKLPQLRAGLLDVLDLSGSVEEAAYDVDVFSPVLWAGGETRRPHLNERHLR